MPAYWQTKEWWESGDPPHYRWGISALAQAHPEVSRPAWGTRRARAMQFDKLEGWGLDWIQLLRGSHDQTHAMDEPPDLVDAVPADVSQSVAADVKIRALTSRLATVQAKYDATLKEGDLEDRIVTKLAEHIPALAPVGPPTFAARGPGKPESVVADISDWHIGEVVSDEEMGGINHYDFDTFMRRWQYYVDSVGGICFGKLTGYDFTELRVNMLGDMVTGVIHDELVETAEGTVMEWLIDGAHICAQGIRQLAAEFPFVFLDCVIGNHGRLQKKPRFKRRYVGWDYLFYHYMKLELADQPNVTFDIHKSFFSVIDVANHRMLNLHGDNIRSWGGIPHYGIQRAVGNFTALLASQRRYFDYVNLAHFHNAGTLDRVKGEIILNGSGVGGDEFSLGALFTSSEPKQIIYGMHPEHGMTWSFKIGLAHGDARDCRFEK